jgi:uncharacterized protein (UPF0335 family)
MPSKPTVGLLADVTDTPPAANGAAQPALPGLERVPDVVDGVAMARVQWFITRWLDLEAKIKDLRADQKDLAEALKAQGIPVRTATMAYKQLKQRRTMDSTLAVFEACQALFAPLLEDPTP